MTNPVSDLLHASSDRLRPSLPPGVTVRRAAERRRRNRRAAAVATPAVLAALVLWLVAAGPLRNTAAPPSPAPPGPVPSHGVLALTTDPFLTELDGHPVLPGSAPVALSRCVISPLALDAAESGVATYGYSGAPPFANEFVIRFSSVAAAHRAVVDAWHQFRRCPIRSNVVTDPLRGPGHRPTTIDQLSESFANQLTGFASHGDIPTSAYPTSMYSIRVGRWRNVVVMLETKGSSDRPEYVLSEAISQATGKRWGTSTN